MPKITSDEARQISTYLEVCSMETEKMSEWEQQFIESISESFEEYGDLTPKQIATLKKIYDKVV